MGNFYTNFTIFDADINIVIAAAKELGRHAYAVKSGNDVILFDRNCDEQDIEEIKMLGTTLSTKLGLRIFGCLNHDDDDLLLWIFETQSNQSFYESISDAPRFAWALSKFRGGLLTYPIVFVVLAWPILSFKFFGINYSEFLWRYPALPLDSATLIFPKEKSLRGFSAEDLKLI